MKLSQSVVGFTAALVLVACEKKPVSIAITPPTVKMDKAGMAQTLSAAGIDADGNKLPVKTTWTSSDPKVASVDANGKVTAVGSGSASISATQETVTGKAAVTVEIASSIKIDPADIKIAKADDKPKAMANVVNEKGAPIAGRPVTFSVADTTIATVDAMGVVTGVKDGVTTLSATSGPLKADAKVEVAGMTPPVEEKKTAKADKKKHK